VTTLVIFGVLYLAAIVGIVIRGVWFPK